MADRVEMYYGESGTGKSEAIAAVIKQVAIETGLRARVLVGDGSKATYIPLIEAGIVDTLDYTTRDYPQSTMQRLAEGWWPADVEDPTSPLVKPDPQKMREFGVYAIEGLSVASNYVLGDNIGGLSYRSGMGEKIGQDSPIRVGDGKYDARGNFTPAFEGAGQFGANPPSHYQVAQRRMLTYVDRSKVLPVKFVIWTAHQRAVEDKISKEIIIGPEVAGAALTANLQRIFNNTLHFATAGKREKGVLKDDHTGRQVDDLDVEYRVYTRDHYSPDSNITYKFKAVTRGVPAGPGRRKDGTYDGMPLYLTGEPGDAIREFYTIIALKGKEAAEEMKTAMEAARQKREAA